MTGVELRRLREDAGLTRWDAAALTGFSAGVIQRIEAGARHIPEDYEGSLCLAVRDLLEKQQAKLAALVSHGGVGR